MKAVYARISTANQNVERQLQGQYQKAFVDVCSGSIPFFERKQAQQLIMDKDVTAIEVKEVSRLGRNLKDILTTLEYFTNKGIDIHIENQGLHTLLPNGKQNPTALLLISILGSIAEQERQVINERTQEGRELAKIKGKYKGRKRGAESKNETLILKYQRTIAFANEMIEAGRSMNYICSRIQEQNEGLPKEARFPGANRQTLTALRDKGLLKRFKNNE